MEHAYFGMIVVSGPHEFVNETHTIRFVTPIEPVQRHLSLSPLSLQEKNSVTQPVAEYVRDKTQWRKFIHEATS